MPALIFDLDGTLVDTVYAHVFAWQKALHETGMAVDGWRIHRKIGMSGGLFTRAVGREIGHDLTDEEAEERAADPRPPVPRAAAAVEERRPLPGAIALLAELRERDVTHGIATSGRRPSIDASLESLGIPEDTVVVERGDVARAKPEPDLFIECARRLGADPADCYVIGDAVWDLLAARRARMLSIGLLSGGYGADELQGAGRVPRLPRRRRAAHLARRARDLAARPAPGRPRTASPSASGCTSPRPGGRAGTAARPAACRAPRRSWPPARSA